MDDFGGMTPVEEGAVSAPTHQLTRAEAEELGHQLQTVAASQARLDHDFCELVERFDSGGALAHFSGIKSTAHFIAWACSMSAGAAREHVRVARALTLMPRVAAHFRDGRLTYSKVRELTRVAGLVSEDELCELALEMTASQLARTIAAYRRNPGSRMASQHKRRFTTHTMPDGMVRITAVLPAEEAALVNAAVEHAARSAQQVELDERESSVPTQAETDRRVLGLLEDVPAGTPPTPPDRVQGLLDVAAHYLDGVPGEPSDDHTLVVLEVAAEQLSPDDHTRLPGLREGRCAVVGQGSVEPATAQRLMCTARILAAVVDQNRDVVNLGRTVRLATKSQRRALRLRDQGVCQFPGCHQGRHLDAHHLVAWSHGGATDLDNLVLLFRRHHVLAHEGGLQLSWSFDKGIRRLRVALPDGRPITGTWLEGLGPDALDALVAQTMETLPRGEEAARVFPTGAGVGFSLSNCVAVLQANELGAGEPDGARLAS